MGGGVWLIVNLWDVLPETKARFPWRPAGALEQELKFKRPPLFGGPQGL